jgi:hypothetical protein
MDIRLSKVFSIVSKPFSSAHMAKTRQNESSHIDDTEKCAFLDRPGVKTGEQSLNVSVIASMWQPAHFKIGQLLDSLSEGACEGRSSDKIFNRIQPRASAGLKGAKEVALTVH